MKNFIWGVCFIAVLMFGVKAHGYTTEIITHNSNYEVRTILNSEPCPIEEILGYSVGSGYNRSLEMQEMRKTRQALDDIELEARLHEASIPAERADANINEIIESLEDND